MVGEGRSNLCKLGTDDGRRIYHLNIITPIVMSNRSIFGCFYEVNDPKDNSYTFIISMKGNEAIAEEYRHRWTNDVLGYVVINYSKFTPCEGGVRMEMGFASMLMAQFLSFSRA